jgi:hypothetical protein
LRINGLLQIRYSYVDYDPAIRYNQEDYSNFFVRRARLYFSGHAGNPRFTYFVHVQLEPSQGLNSNDLWVEYSFSDMLRLGAGRNKISYGLEFMNSGSALGMVERSLMYGETDIDVGPATEPGPRYPGGGTHRFGLSWYADTGFATGGMTLFRSQGVQLQGQRGSDSTPTFEYQVGLWQGRSTTSLSNGGNNHLVAARIGYHPWGFVDWRVTMGWDVVPRKLEVRARHAEITRLKDPTYRKAVDSGLGIPEVWDGKDWVPALEATISETSAAVSYSLPGWRNKIALDVSRLERQFAADPDAVIDGVATPIARAPDQVDYRIRAMVQLVF